MARLTTKNRLSCFEFIVLPIYVILFSLVESAHIPGTGASRPRAGVSSKAQRRGISLPTYKRQQLVALLLHQRLVVGLNVEAQERLGIGWAHIEPPVSVVYRDAVHVID